MSALNRTKSAQTTHQAPADPTCLQKTHLDTCPRICSGDAWWPYNILCSPFVLVFNSFYHYFVACIGVFFYRFFTYICCFPCRTLFPDTWNFTDKKFPPVSSSILQPGEPCDHDNPFYGLGLAEVSRKIEWMRADEVVARKRKDGEEVEIHLFEGGVSPSDIVQGKLGDCWLLAALASMAEYPEAIRNCFVQNERSPRHKYRVKLWDIENKQWLHLSVDDYVPVAAGTHNPYFSEPNGHELWAFLIEKAFAKYHGGYAYLDGGFSSYAWHLLTGDNVFLFEYDNTHNVWMLYVRQYEGIRKGTRRDYRAWREDTGERCDRMRIFSLIKQFTSQRAPMSAAIHSSVATHGLIKAHAYSVIKAYRKDNIRLIKLRNPWGRGEWTGAWSDKDDMWNRHPDIRDACKQVSNDEDGTFWMSLEDFNNSFDKLEVCDRSSHRDIRLDVREDDGACGVAKGCAVGCARFWCCCRGVRTIYWGHRSGETIQYRAPWYTRILGLDDGHGWNENETQV